MFQGLFRRAESTIDNAVSKLMARAAVAVLLLIAGGFASAALTVWLIERYGAIVACAMMAALFGVIGLVTMAALSGNGTRPAEQAEAAEATADSTGDDASEDGMNPLDLLTPEVRAFLASAAPMAIPVVARGVGRNLPLIFMLALVGFVISRFATTETATGEAGKADGAADDAPPPVPQHQPDLRTGAEAAA